MLPQKERLRSAQVREVLKNGKSLRTDAVLVKYIPTKSSQAAVVVSKKIAKSAVARNRIRRMIYGALPHPLGGGSKAVLLVQKNIPSYTADIQTICSKLFS